MPPVSEQLRALQARMVVLETEAARLRTGMRHLSRCVKFLWTALAPVIVGLLGRYLGVY